MNVTSERVRSIVLIVLAFAMFAAAALTPRFPVIPIFVGLICLVIAGSSLSDAGALARSLRMFRGRGVEVRVWGQALPGAKLESVRALGAGLHLFLRTAEGSRGHLKVAQPRDSRVGTGSIDIGNASYVQWQGKKLPRSAEAVAVTISWAGE